MSREAGSDYQFVESDAAAIVAALIDSYERITGRTIRPGSVERMFIAWVADVITQICVQVNFAGNQNIPSRAEGENLDALGELFFDSERPDAKAASVTMRFVISEAQSSSVLVPAGTRVTTSNGGVVYATSADAYIEIGDIQMDVNAVCEDYGTVGNGYIAGQINKVVDVFPYYESCTNIDTSDGGADEASDDEFYDIMRSSQDAYSDAGAQGGYVYFAKRVSTKIADVKAIQPVEHWERSIPVYDGHAFLGGDGLKEDTLVVYPHGTNTHAVIGEDYAVDYVDGLLAIEIMPGGLLEGQDQLDIEIDVILGGHVRIYVLMDDGTIATPTIKSLVLAACNPDHVRPLTDMVAVEDPNQVSYNIILTYYTSTNSTKSASEIQAAVTGAVDEYKAWQSAKLGRDINPDELVYLLKKAGIKRVDLTAPTFVTLADGGDNGVPDIACVRTVSITDGGYEDE